MGSRGLGALFRLLCLKMPVWKKMRSWFPQKPQMQSQEPVQGPTPGAPQTEEAAGQPATGHRAGRHPRAAWHRVAEGRDSMSPSPARSLQGEAATTLRPQDCAPHSPALQPSIAGPVGLAIIPTHSPPNENSVNIAPAKGMSKRDNTSVLVSPRGPLPRPGALLRHHGQHMARGGHWMHHWAPCQV